MADPSSPDPSSSPSVAPRILVVDDEEEVRRLVAESLEELGYRVHAVADAEAALEALAGESDFALMMTDVQMPGGSGLDLAARVRVGWPRVRVLLVSGYFVPEGTPRPFLRKPFDTKELAAAVQAALG